MTALIKVMKIIQVVKKKNINFQNQYIKNNDVNDDVVKNNELLYMPLEIIIGKALDKIAPLRFFKVGFFRQVPEGVVTTRLNEH